MPAFYQKRVHNTPSLPRCSPLPEPLRRFNQAYNGTEHMQSLQFAHGIRTSTRIANTSFQPFLSQSTYCLFLCFFTNPAKVCVLKIVYML